jgi:dTDP-glucose 4,6-dehydratase
MNILVTGGAGFIGSNFIRLQLAAGDGGVAGEGRIVNLDLLTYAGNLENLAEWAQHPRYRFVRGDIGDRAAVAQLLADERIDAVVNFAAESHVDRSIDAPRAFMQTNTLGTQTLLEAAAAHGVARFVQVSTDEVYGSLGDQGRFTETSPLRPNSAYHRTFGLPVMITRCSNNYGPDQFPEKLIPLMIANALERKPLPVYGDGGNVRDWIYVEDHCRALERVLHAGRPGEVYNIGGNSELPNLLLVKTLLAQLDAPESLIEFVADRPGHDRRYAIDAGKIAAELGWQPEVPFADGLARTVRWYREHQAWWEKIRSGAYRDYYEAMYGPGGRHAADLAAEDT